MMIAQMTQHSTVGPRSFRQRVPSILQSGLAIFCLKASMKVRGYAWTLAWIRRHVANVPVVRDVDAALITASEWAVAMAAAFYPGRAQCLERSLVLYYLLRRQGIAVRYCHGAQPYPLVSHAWIEYQGHVINDVPERVNQFSRFPDQLP